MRSPPTLQSRLVAGSELYAHDESAGSRVPTESTQSDGGPSAIARMRRGWGAFY